jgi:hypothetical protein
MAVLIEVNLVLFALSFLSGMLGGEAAFAAHWAEARLNPWQLATTSVMATVGAKLGALFMALRVKPPCPSAPLRPCWWSWRSNGPSPS